jgi:hypothetical protein
MVALPTRYYVQSARIGDPADPSGAWKTDWLTFDREWADAYAKSLETGALSQGSDDETLPDGVAAGDGSDSVSTTTRVMTAEELRAEDPDALRVIEFNTMPVFWAQLAAWAERLIDPGHT